MRTFIVGDIHGCLNTFDQMLNKIGFESKSDKMFCTGDLIDRGNFSENVLQMFRLSSSLKSVRGNHDDKYVRWLKGHNVTISEQDGNYGSHYGDVGILKSTYISFIDSLPLVLHPTENTTIVHAGFYPWMNHLTVPETFDKKKRTLMFIRHITGSETDAADKSIKNIFFDENLPMWYELYKDQPYGGTVFCGHQPVKDYIVTEGKTKIISLDTGACFGNKLTCYCLETEEFTQVNTAKEDLNERSIRQL